MGDMADYYVDLSLDQGEGFATKRYTRDAYGPPVKCTHCNSTGVFWQRRRGEYKLFDKDSLAVHVCPRFKPTAEGFDDEPVL